jgi:hypothetical protein
MTNRAGSAEPSTAIQREFAAALTSPYGVVRISTAMRTIRVAIERARAAEISWPEITSSLNLALAEKGRPPVCVDTVRGMHTRHRNHRDSARGTSRLRQTTRPNEQGPPSGIASSLGELPTSPATNPIASRSAFAAKRREIQKD